MPVGRDRADMNDTTTHPLDRLRLALRANAAFSLASGTAALVAGPWLSRQFGIDHVALTRLLGVGLCGFAALVLAAARAPDERLPRDALVVSLADAAWVLGTLPIVAAGILAPTGNVAAALVAVVVADLGATQLLRRARATDSRARARTVVAGTTPLRSPR